MPDDFTSLSLSSHGLGPKRPEDLCRDIFTTTLPSDFSATADAGRHDETTALTIVGLQIRVTPGATGGSWWRCKQQCRNGHITVHADSVTPATWSHITHTQYNPPESIDLSPPPSPPEPTDIPPPPASPCSCTTSEIDAWLPAIGTYHRQPAGSFHLST